MPFLQAGIALLAGSVLLLEIALTRVFAITMWHHLAYMVISLALLGFGAAGSLLTALRAGTRTASPARALAALSAAYGVAVVAAYFAVSRIGVDTLELWSDKRNVLRLLGVALAVFVPFLLAGAAIGLLLTRHARDASKLYACDLLGSALGGCASVWLLASLGGSAVVLLAAFLGALSACLFAAAAGRRAVVLSALPAGAVGAVFASFAFGTLGERWVLPFAPRKEFSTYYADRLAEIDRIPSATAEVEVAPEERLPPIAGGDFGLRWVSRPVALGRLLGQDGAAPTVLYRDAAAFEGMEFLGATQVATGYVARAARGAVDPHVLVIGVGGGVDVMVALYHGAAEVTAVELNRAMIDVVTRRYDDYLGGLFRPGAHPFSDRIRLVHGEGRSFARKSDARYDLIQMSGVDSFTALSTGAYTLSESYLYTVEAVQDFYGRLSEGGIVNYSRFILTPPQRPRETMRLANIAHAALAELGVSDPAAQIAIFRGHDWASTMIKRGPFEPVEIEALDAYAAEHGFWGLVYDPLGRPDARAPGEPHVGTDRLAQLRLSRELSPPRVPELPAAEWGALFDSSSDAFRLAFAGDPAGSAALLDAAARRAAPEEPGPLRGVLGAAVDAAVERARTEDAAFDVTQADFRTLLRGSPAERERFVAAYPYDLSPCSDDDPFFFNYFRFASLLEGPPRAAGTANEAYTGDYPVGHVVLVSSLVQITLLGLLLILAPLRFAAGSGAARGGRLRVFLYFAALGAGFMLVEIVLMQKMVLFLGHPTYAVSVVLTSLLAFAGLGSLFAARLDADRPRVFRALAVLVPALVLAEAVLVERELPGLLALSFPARVACAVALLAPLGTLLGMPFPLGLRHVAPRWPELLPWAWAINAFLSVFSSIFAILLGMQVGFTHVLFAGAAVYAVGLAALGLGPGKRRA